MVFAVGLGFMLVPMFNLDRFIRWTVPGGYYAAAFVLVIVFLGKAGPALLLFALIDAAAATWIWLALRSSAKTL